MTLRSAEADLRPLGHALFHLCAAGVFIVGVVFGVQAFASRNDPVHWGTFTERELTCNGSHDSRDCTLHGAWESDDHSVHLGDVALDGNVRTDGKARAAFQPGAWPGDSMVHTSLWFHLGPWLAWLCPAIAAWASWHQHHEWRARARERERAEAPCDDGL